MDDEDEEFERTAKSLRSRLDAWLSQNFGDKCDHYEPGCECCERWKLAEELLAFDRVKHNESGPS